MLVSFTTLLTINSLIINYLKSNFMKLFYAASENKIGWIARVTLVWLCNLRISEFFSIRLVNSSLITQTT